MPSRSSAPETLESLPGYVRGLAGLGARAAIIERRLFRTARWSYAELLACAENFAAWLTGSGIAVGEHVVLWGEGGGAWAAAYYGCILAGAVVVPLDASFSAAFAARVVEHTEARLICTDHDADFAARRIRFEAVLGAPAAQGARVADRAPAPAALLEIVYTSGATADPKGVMITHGNILANLRPIAIEVEKYRSKAWPLLPLRFLHLIPPSHLFGQVMGLLIPPLLQSAVIYPETQSAAQWAAIIREERASVMVCVPQQLALFAEWAEANGGGDRERAVLAAAGHKVGWRWWQWRRLHRRLGWRMWAFVIGGAALPAQLESYWNAFGYAVVQGYGLTETAPAIAITHPFKIRRGAVGRKLAGVDLRIAADGEILVRGGNVSPGYYRDDDATARAFADGWLHTGDLGHLDEQGNLHFSGRKKDVIVTADGLNVYPEDVERALDAEPEVAESAVVEEKRAGGGQVHAVAVMRAGAADLAGAVARANAHLETHQRIRGFSTWPHPHLPRTASTHKLRRAAVVAWVNHSRGAVAATSAAAPADWREFVGARWGITADRLRPEARLEQDLGLSSLDRVELLTWIESHGAVGVDDTDFTRVQTVADLEAAHRFSDRGRAGGAPPGPTKGSAPGAARKLDLYADWPMSPLLRPPRAAAVHGLLFPALRVAVRHLRVEGLETLQVRQRPVLFVANHQSLLDVPVILKALPRAWRPWLAPAMGADLIAPYLDRQAAGWRRLGARLRLHALRMVFNTYLLTQTGGITSALRYSGKLADHGYCPLIFPEGARTRNGMLQPFRPGIGVFVETLRLPVVPIVLNGLYEILPVTRPSLRRGNAAVRFGPPLSFPRATAAEITAALQAWYEKQPPLGD